MVCTGSVERRLPAGVGVAGTIPGVVGMVAGVPGAVVVGGAVGEFCRDGVCAAFSETCLAKSAVLLAA